MAKFKRYAQVDVALPGHHYPIIIGTYALKDFSVLRGLVTAKQVLVVTNQTIAPLYLDCITAIFSEIQCDVLVLPDGEMYKNQDSLSKIYDALITNHHHRDTTLIALGGGVIGDITGFAAATYQRGVPFIQIPTTLLAQVDASVGGKTAINHPAGKNMIGSFYQPKAVLIDLDTLVSLPQREFKAGLAEIIKYGLLDGDEFFTFLEHAIKSGLNAQHPDLPYIIERCCQIKARYVEGDEREQGARAMLNLGHTFAHALEAYTHYQRWLHGEAVAIGLYCAALLSQKLGLMDASLLVRIESMLKYAGLPHKIPASIDRVILRDFMSMDKKIKNVTDQPVPTSRGVSAGSSNRASILDPADTPRGVGAQSRPEQLLKNNGLRFVLIKKPGDCYLDDQVTEDCLSNTLIAAAEGDTNE